MLIASGAFAQDTKSAEKGRKIFIEKRCYTCHTIQAEADLIEKEKEAFARSRGLELKDEDNDDGENGDEKDSKKGGDLSDVGKEREVKWIKDFIQNPRDYFKDSPECRRLGKKKHRKRFKGSGEELEALVGYISALKHPAQEKKEDTCLKD